MKADRACFSDQVAPDRQRRNAMDSDLQQSAAVGLDVGPFEAGAEHSLQERLGIRATAETAEDGLQIAVHARRPSTLRLARKAWSPLRDHRERIGKGR